MQYRCETTSIAGFVQQVAVSYVANGYWFYVAGCVPQGKDRRALDAKIIASDPASEMSGPLSAETPFAAEVRHAASILDFPKIEEALPFMSWEEAEARIAAGDDPERIWDCVYLRPEQISELLDWVKIRPVSTCVYPMFVFAAHTGARRSEIVRALPSDVDLKAALSRSVRESATRRSTRPVAFR
jgi:hypothetical protein